MEIHNSLEESIIIAKDNFGNQTFKINSELSESFLVIEKGKNLNELSKHERNALKELDDLHNFQKNKEYLNKASGIYTFAYYLVGIGKWILLI